MEINEELRSEILKIIENQLNSYNPVETKKLTLDYWAYGAAILNQNNLLDNALLLKYLM